MPMAFPKSQSAVNGAMVLRLAATPAEGDVAVVDMARLMSNGPCDGIGSVAQLWKALTAACE